MFTSIVVSATETTSDNKNDRATYEDTRLGDVLGLERAELGHV